MSNERKNIQWDIIIYTMNLLINQSINQSINQELYLNVILAAELRRRLEFSLRMRKVGCSNCGRDRPKSLELVVTAPLLKLRSATDIRR